MIQVKSGTENEFFCHAYDFGFEIKVLRVWLKRKQIILISLKFPGTLVPNCCISRFEPGDALPDAGGKIIKGRATINQ